MRITRKDRAVELLRLVKKGPAYLCAPIDMDAADWARAQYKLWAETWVIGELIKLVPELKDEKR